MQPPSMMDLFPACAAVLREQMCPTHYRVLTSLALQRLGRDDVIHDRAAWNRACEDVREKMLLARRYGTGYVGAPQCMGFMTDWFDNQQPDLLNTDTEGIRIAGSASTGLRAAFETLMRFPYMLTKQADGEARRRAAARGMVIEHHVSDWFRERWPMFWKAPDNAGRWERWCAHDFKLELPSGAVLVDVMGPRNDGSFAPPASGKRAVDCHVLADIDGRDVVMRGFVPGRRLAETFAVEHAMPMVRLVVWLNCESRGLDYRQLRAA